MKVIFLVEVANNADEVSLLDPKLDCPAASKRHLEENWALHEACENRLSVLVHRRAQFKFHYGCVIRLSLIELYFEKLVDETLFLSILATFSFLVVNARRLLVDHLVEQSW